MRLLVDMAVTKHYIIIATVLHKIEELVHHHAAKALNGYHRVETIHHKIEVERVTTKMGIISIIYFRRRSSFLINMSVFRFMFSLDL